MCTHNARTRQHGESALSLAVRETKSNVKLVSLLLSANADINWGRWTKRHHFASVPPSTAVPPIAVAAQTGKLDYVQLLLQHGCEVDAPTGDGASALWLAVESRHLEVARELVEHGADVNWVRDCQRAGHAQVYDNTHRMEGCSVLTIAQLCGHSRIEALLASAGAESRCWTASGAGREFLFASVAAGHGGCCGGRPWVSELLVDVRLTRCQTAGSNAASCSRSCLTVNAVWRCGRGDRDAQFREMSVTQALLCDSRR